MNTNWFSRLGLGALAVSLLGCLLAVYGLVKIMQLYTQPEPVNAARVVERTQALTEQRAQEAKQLHHYGWVDQTRGIVRLPVSNAVEVTLLEYRDPVAARSNLLTRLEKATAPLPKAAPPPNPFE